MKKIFSIVFFIFFIACTKRENFIQSDGFELALVDGSSIFVRRDDEGLSFDNKEAILFVFFTTWCPPCIAKIPHLNQLQSKYKDQFDIVGILLEDKSDDELRAFIEKNQIIYKIANGENNYLLAKTLGGIRGIPTMFLYNKDSHLLQQYLGFIPQEMLEIDIQKAIF